MGGKARGPCRARLSTKIIDRSADLKSGDVDPNRESELMLGRRRLITGLAGVPLATILADFATGRAGGGSH